jgi:hypothetical protein
MGVFAKVAANAQATSSKSKKDDDLVLENAPDHIKAKVDLFVTKKKEAKAAGDEAKKINDQILNEWLWPEYVGMFIKDRVQPEHVKIKGVNTTVGLIVQDRSGNYNVKDDQLDIMIGILGEKRAKSLVHDWTDYSFNNELLNKPGVIEILEKAMKEMVETKVLTQDEVDKLLVGEYRRTFKPGVLARLPELSEGDQEQALTVIDGLKTNVVKYLQ